MTIYAEINDGVVSNTILSDTKNEVSWVLCPKGVGIGHLYDGTNFSPPNVIVTEEQVREERDDKLAETDWMASSDLTMSSEWATYRQALRDVPAQAGFPENVTWPLEPT